MDRLRQTLPYAQGHGLALPVLCGARSGIPLDWARLSAACPGRGSADP